MSPSSGSEHASSHHEAGTTVSAVWKFTPHVLLCVIGMNCARAIAVEVHHVSINGHASTVDFLWSCTCCFRLHPSQARECLLLREILLRLENCGWCDWWG